MGSLFQLRDFWYKSFPEEEFSTLSVAVGDIDNLDTMDKIAVGSFQGYLRILIPGNERGEMKPEDLLCETKFDEPILQVACGRYQPVSADISRNLLAVLFPRRLAFFSVERCGSHHSHHSHHRDDAERPGRDDDDDAAASNMGIYYRCTKHFETHFDHTVYNFTSGPFGRVNYDLVCVQSMDGQLTIIDHNKVICQRFLPSNQFLVPGSLTYIPQRDAFVTNNSSLFLLCYTFRTITNSVGSERKDSKDKESAASSEADGFDGAGSAVGGEGAKITPAWAYNLGDDAVDVRCGRLTRGLSNDEANIIVLCPYAFYVLSLDGECLLMRRLDVESCALCAFPLHDTGADNLLIGALNGSVYVFSDVALEWSAKMPNGNAEQLYVSSFCGTEGMILVLNSTGTLSINYLGTDPADKPIQPLESQAASFADMAREQRFMDKAILRLLNEETGTVPITKPGTISHTASTTGASESSETPTHALPHTAAPAVTVTAGGLVSAALPAEEAAVPVAAVSHSPPPAPEFPLNFGFGKPVAREDGTFVIPLEMSYKSLFEGLQSIHDVVVQASAVAPVTVSMPNEKVSKIEIGESITLPIIVEARPDTDQIIPSSLELSAVVLFTAKRYDTWAYRKTIQLPLSLLARPVPPVKNTSFSVQLNTNKSPPPSLESLFDDLAPFGNVTVNVLSLRYLNGADATVLVSKNAARFKLQGSTMEGLWLLTAELVRRLEAHYAADGDLVFSIPDDMPVDDFVAIVDTHTAIRKELALSLTALDKAAEFVRSVERRLLARFRDRNPSNSPAISVLFEESYAALQRATDGVILAKSRQRQACAMLNCCSRLFFFWMRVKFPDSVKRGWHSDADGGEREGRRRRSAAALKQPSVTVQDALRELFTCEISADDGVGWEEVAETAFVELLDVKARKTTSTTLEVSLNTVNLKKLLRQVVERVKSGQAL